jgi:hypothetical protein
MLGSTLLCLVTYVTAHCTTSGRTQDSVALTDKVASSGATSSVFQAPPFLSRNRDGRARKYYWNDENNAAHVVILLVWSVNARTANTVLPQTGARAVVLCITVQPDVAAQLTPA